MLREKENKIAKKSKVEKLKKTQNTIWRFTLNPFDGFLENELTDRRTYARPYHGKFCCHNQSERKTNASLKIHALTVELNIYGNNPEPYAFNGTPIKYQLI